MATKKPKQEVWRERKNYYKGRDYVPENPRGPNKKNGYLFEQKTSEQVVYMISVRANSEEEARTLIAKGHRTVHWERQSDITKVPKRGAMKLVRERKGSPPGARSVRFALSKIPPVDDGDR
jgi:hypothetical protein